MLCKVLLAVFCAATAWGAQSESAPQSRAEGSGVKDVPAGLAVPSGIVPGKAEPGEIPQNKPQPTPAPTAKPPALSPETAEKNAGSKTPEEQSQALRAPDVPPTRKSSTEKNLPDIPHADSAPYVIGPLDVLVIKVWGQQNLTGPVDVAADGNISMPLIGDVKADGLTKEQLKADIAKRLSEYLNNPEVDVQVVKINSKSFFVYGAVGRPGEYPLIKATTIMDAMSSVGGFGGFANTKKIYILRKAPSGEMKKIYFNWKEVSQGKRMEQNIYLQNGDRIFVPGSE